jgi:RNA-directed DNA polymerase
MKKYSNLFNKIVEIEKLFDAWYAFRKGKRKRYDVQAFERRVEENLFKLKRDLESKKYSHGLYDSFYVFDPKVRHIRKANVKDRLVHQALNTALSEVYEPKLMYHLYSARIGKGTHKAVKALREMTLRVSKNNTIKCFGS